MYTRVCAPTHWTSASCKRIFPAIHERWTHRTCLEKKLKKSEQYFLATCRATLLHREFHCDHAGRAAAISQVTRRWREFYFVHNVIVAAYIITLVKLKKRNCHNFAKMSSRQPKTRIWTNADVFFSILGSEMCNLLFWRVLHFRATQEFCQEFFLWHISQTPMCKHVNRGWYRDGARIHHSGLRRVRPDAARVGWDRRVVRLRAWRQADLHQGVLAGGPEHACRAGGHLAPGDLLVGHRAHRHPGRDLHFWHSVLYGDPVHVDHGSPGRNCFRTHVQTTESDQCDWGEHIFMSFTELMAR